LTFRKIVTNSMSFFNPNKQKKQKNSFERM
jgi:hypothetical protein